MSLEVEMKFPVPPSAGLEDRLTRSGARFRTERTDADHYFNAPDRDFAQTDEALRLRRIASANFITYKGPKRDLQTKTRTEVEVPLADGEEAAQGLIEILTYLRYRPVAVVRKRRRIYQLERGGFDVEICLDEVANVGQFAELEIVVPEDQLDSARATLQQLAAELGLSRSERRSYLELLLEAQGKKGP